MTPVERDDFRKLAREEWAALVAADHQPDLELLAAYLDGGIAPSDERAVAEEIARSPRAFDLLQQLLHVERQLPTVAATPESAVPTNKPVLPREAPILPQETPVQLPLQTPARRVSDNWRILAMAASVLLAIGGVFAYLQMQPAGDLLAEQRLRNELREQQVLTAKLEVAQATASYSSPTLVGSVNQLLLASALRVEGEIGRGGPNPTPNASDAAVIDDAVTAASQVIETARQQSEDASAALRLDEIAILIQAGRLDEADRLLTEAEKSDTPAVRNARGVWLLRSALKDPRNATRLFDEAEQKLQSATAGEPLAWLNLSALYEAQFEAAKAAQAARQFAKESKDPAIQRLIDRRFPPQSLGSPTP